MNKAETLMLMKIIRGYYPMYYRNDDAAREAAILWEKVLADQDFLQIQKGLEEYVKTDTKGFPPVPGQLITLARDIRLAELEQRRREQDLLPEPETQGIPMPEEMRKKFNAMLDGMKI